MESLRPTKHHALVCGTIVDHRVRPSRVTVRVSSEAVNRGSTSGQDNKLALKPSTVEYHKSVLHAATVSLGVCVSLTV